MRTLYFACLLLLALGAAQAQRRARPALPPPADAPVQTARTELALTSSNSEVHVLPLPADSAVLLLLGRDRRQSSQQDFSLQLYGPDLRLRRDTPVPVPEEFRFAKLTAEGSAAFALFRSRTVEGRLWALAYDARSGAVRTQQFDTKLSREVVELKALDGRLFATVLLADGQHVTALLLDVASGFMQYLPAVYEPLPTQFSFLTDAPSRRAEYVLSQTNGRKSRLLLKHLTGQGQLLESGFVQAESDRSLITAQLSPPRDSATRLLTGTYSLRDPTYAQGLFATDLTAGPSGAHSPLRFYDFLNLKHFFDYLSPTRQARLRRRVERRVARAAPALRWHYRLLLHELLPQPHGGYILLAEVYYPHYRYNSYGGLGPASYSPFYTPGYSSSRVFDGYQTTQVLACGFDARGALLWDNSFVVDNLRRYELEETVRAQPLPDGRLALAYLDDEHLRYKVLNRAADAPNDLKIPLQTAPQGIEEHVLDTEQADVQPWFGARFVASGYQRIRRPGAGEREVFFLNAVTF